MLAVSQEVLHLADHPEFAVGGVRVIGLHLADPVAVVKYYLANKSRLAYSMPLRSDDFYTDRYWQACAQNYRAEFEDGRAVRFVLQAGRRVIGTLNFDQIMMGAFRACYLGYSLDQAHEGCGLMTRALQPCLRYMLEKRGLNRIMANHVPQNVRSANLLKRLGFEREGCARNYLLLNGVWQDHVLNSLVAHP
jgi:[ribosomal protein S5]-alanine N-acetyltransferase